MARLLEGLNDIDQKQNQANNQVRWKQHNSLERGNPIRIYAGPDFKLRK